ncbi:MAG: hypothetical protein WAK55_09670 [Xanthobacteraceae bacterium]
MAVIETRSLAERVAGVLGVRFKQNLRVLLAVRPLFALAAMAVVLARSALAAPSGQSAITCTNPASGIQWQIKVDYDRSTVDSNPARISDGNISWHDASDGGNYTLDRKSGNLTVIVASSTGGYFLHDRCKLDN